LDGAESDLIVPLQGMSTPFGHKSPRNRLIPKLIYRKIAGRNFPRSAILEKK